MWVRQPWDSTGQTDVSSSYKLIQFMQLHPQNIIQYALMTNVWIMDSSGSGATVDDCTSELKALYLKIIKDFYFKIQ